MENPGYYAIIPATVRYSTVTPNAKLLYGEITALSNKCGYCYASNSYFSSLYGVSKNSINNWLAELIDNGFIKREIVYGKDSKQVVGRYLRIVETPIQNNLDTPQEILEGSPKNLEEGTQEILEGSPRNFGYNNNTLNNTNNITSNNPTGMGEISNQNNILENNNQIEPKPSQISAPKVKPPKVKASSRLPKEVLGKIAEWDNNPEVKSSLENYCLFMLDTYNEKPRTLVNKLTHICRMANNVPKGIQIICDFNIDRSYKQVYKPSDYNKQLADCVVESKAYEGDFVRDQDGNIEEIW